MPTEPTDPYAVLGLTPHATQAQIRRAYRELVRQNHPDTRPQSEPAEGSASSATLRQVLAAYEVLGDPARRARHDGRTRPRPRTRTTGGPARPEDALPIAFATRLPGRFPAPFSPGAADDPPPIQAGPVRWHPSR